MNKDDPFASPDSDRTIIMPSPGGRAPTQGQQASHKPPPSGSFVETDTSTVVSGLNPLIAAANPLLNVVSQLRVTMQHTDPMGLRDYIAQHIKTFENQAKAAGILPEKVIAARYVLCTLLDETISSTPWGNGVWGKHSLLVMFHNEASGGEKFFLLLTKLAENPKANRDILEFMSICLALGFEGRYRVMDNGKTHLEELRERLTQILNKERGNYERDLSPHWQAAFIKRAKIFLLLPLWVLSALCGLILLVSYLTFSYLLNSSSDPVFAQIQSIHIKDPIPEYAPLPLPSITPSITEFLREEIQEGLVAVNNRSGNNVVITLLGDGIFASGSTAISNNFVKILTRIANKLNSVSGQVQITGHTDNRPINSIRFPSNWHLSQERADSVKQLLIKMGTPESRLSAVGHADTEPVDSNNTSEGRARNRRVEIILIAAHENK